MASDESTGRLEGCLGFRELEVEEGGSDMTLSRIKAATDHYHHHQDVVWTWTCFGKVAKGIMKQHPQGTVSKLGQLGEVYNEVAVFARKLGREDLVQILSQLCSGLLELEDHRRKLERSHIDEESDEEFDDLGRQSTSPGGFKIFVEVLRFGVEKMAYESGDDLLESFDLLSQACWCTIESMRSLPFAHLTIRLGVPKDVEFVEANLGLCMLLVGMALTALGDEEEGLNYMESAYEMFQSDLESTLSTHHLQLVLARAYAEGDVTKDHRKAARMFEAAATTAKDLHTMLVMDMEAASHWIKVPEERATKGVTKIQAVLEQALQILPMEWALQARLYFEAGTAHLEAGGDMEDHQAVEYLEAATRLCVGNDFSAVFLAQDSHEHVRKIVMGLAQLLALYSAKENLAAALALHQAVNPILVKLKSVTSDEKLWNDTAWRVWQQALDVFTEATGTGYYVNVKEEEISSRIGWDISEFMLNENIGGGKTYRFAMADHFQNLADAEAENLNWPGAVDNMNLLEEKLRRRGVLTNKAKVGLHVNRANYFMSGGQLSQASEEIQKALEITHEEDDQDQDRSIMRKIYTTQSRIFWELRDLDAALASLDKAEMACEHRSRYLRGIRMFRVQMWMKAGKLEMAEELARETALECADAQSELGIESAWVHYLDNTGMATAFSNVETLHRAMKKDMMKALVWAERGRARLFMHRADPSGAKEFDKSDQFADDILSRTIQLCGPGTVILECSIIENNVFVLYALFFHPKEGVGCCTHDESLNTFFEKPENRVDGRKMNLEKLVVEVRDNIRRKDDEIAMSGLAILHTLLVQNIFDAWPDLLSICTHIIFSPQGMLHLVPFMALYDGTAKKFLIEQKAISVIPSICSLAHCFARQQKFETKFQALDGAFIAGNPEPMGVERLSLRPLPGAAEEAQSVAKILGVETCKEENITKEAVITALSKSSVVLLATHGLTAQHKYPFGAVVLRKMSRSDYSEAGTSRTQAPSSEQHEVLTSEEIIASIDQGGISAGLVVLSACHTGVGEVSREGLLGLGHALLEAGASSAIVDLWDVNDGSIGILIADVFKELKNGTDLVHSVQKAVVDMLRDSEHRKIQDWSALTLLGSPSFQLPGHKVTSKQDILDKDYRHASQLLADDIGGSVIYLRSVVHYYAVLAKQLEDEGDFHRAIAVVNFLEQTLQKNGLVSGDIAKSKLHLWRGIYLNQLNGRSLEALKELREAIEVLVDLDKTSPELIALVFLEQARAYIKFRDRNAAIAVLDRALESMAKSNHTNMLLDYHCKVFRCFALSDDREFKAAASLVGEAAHLEGDSPNIWIPFVDDNLNLRSAFSLYETLSFGQGDVNKAVVWAEQGLIDVVDSSRDDNIETDSAAASSMLKTVGLCGPNTIIIKFSYDHQNLLMLYGLSSKVSVCSRKYLKGFFREEANRVMGSSLEELVSRVRQYISKGEDEVAVLGLSILYNLLVKPIFVDYKEFFAGYTKIIFAPQGFLCKVPFSALYDASEGKFLVEQVAVGVIPSLRSLHRCFSRQDTSLKHSNVFVGGNPEQLPGTCQAAQEVAGILDVEVCPGSNLTKETVLQGAFRTCEEVAALAGKMRASLVVTIGACHKGDEQDDSDAVGTEGLLGLGHAVLEAGAVTTIASLWDVNDDVLTPLISSLFRELKQGNDVLCSMQKAMKDMVRSTEIRHWASLTVLGSPTLQISTRPQTTHQPAPAPAPESKNQTVVSLDFLQKNCLKVLDVVTELGPLHALPQEVCGTVLEKLAAVEIEKMKKAELEGCGPVAEIVGCGYLGMVYGGMGDWNTARRWLVRSLSVAKENWERVKDALEPDPLAMSALYISFLLRLHGTSSLNSDLDLIRFVLRSTVPSNERVFDNIHQVLAIWE